MTFFPWVVHLALCSLTLLFVLSIAYFHKSVYSNTAPKFSPELEA